MHLKLKQSIVSGKGQFLPPAIVSIQDLGIGIDEARVLVRRDFAEEYVPGAEPAVEEPAGGPEVVTLQTVASTEPDGKPGAAMIEGTLAGVVDDNGKARDLEDMKKADLVRLAAEMGLDVAGKTKDELIAAIKAEPVQAPADEVTPAEE